MMSDQNQANQLLIRITLEKNPKPSNPCKPSKPLTHIKCRCCNEKDEVFYQTGPKEPKVKRPFVPNEQVDWNTCWKYEPVEYTAPVVLANPPWADPIKPTKETKWNNIDEKVDRRSHTGEYSVFELPFNPVGRTGIYGRGLLGRWGPNHAADPIVTRWKRLNGNIVTHPLSQKRILQFVAIQRTDTNEWAIPGGMCDAGEKVSNTMKREFMEEALNSYEISPAELEAYKKKLNYFFENGLKIFSGYVDDPRNTDNAWMETVAYNFHDEEGSIFDSIKLQAGDDAKHVKWLDIDSSLKLYASHKDFIESVAQQHNAHW